MKIEIENINNGYLLMWVDEDNEGKPMTHKLAIEEAPEVTEYEQEEYKTSCSEKVALGKLLNVLSDFFGEMYQKYDTDNISITFDKKGSKVDDE